jgi:hypothetical protein
MKVKGKVKAVSGPREHEGKWSIGFMLHGSERWYNATNEEKEPLNQFKKEFLGKGNEIAFVLANNEPTEMKLLEKAKPSEKENWADDLMNFESLMKAAHKLQVPFSIKTECLNVDLEKKYALFKATVVGESMERDGVKTDQVTFEGHGDATDSNVKGDHIKPHFIRMAETRAIARALRWYTNNAGECAEEEK